MKKKTRVALLGFGIVLALLVAAFFSLPYLVKAVVNKKLAHLENYVGHVDGVSLRLWRGAIRFDKLTMIVRGSKAAAPLVAIDAVDADYSWKALVHSGFVGDVVLHQPVIHYIQPPPKRPQAGPQPPPQETAEIAKKSVVKAHEQQTDYVKTLKVEDGRLEWQDDAVKPGYTIYLRDLNATAYNIGSKPGLTKERTSAMLTGKVMDQGDLELEIVADALAAKPTFKYQLSMTDVALPQLNDWLRKYLYIEAHDGTLNFYNEADAANGNVKGYVKPLIVGLNAVQVKGGKSIVKQIQGEVEKLATKAFRNPKEKQIGTVVAFSGNLGGPRVKVWQAMVTLVRNAFIKALKPGLSGFVNLAKGLGG